MGKEKSIRVVIIPENFDEHVQIKMIPNTLEGFQACVKGCIENVLSLSVDTVVRRVLKGKTIYANEEGILQDMRINTRASTLLNRGLVGPVIILTLKGMTAEQAREVAAIVPPRGQTIETVFAEVL